MNKYFVWYGLKIDDVDLLAIKEEIEIVYKGSVPIDHFCNFLGPEKVRLFSILGEAMCHEPNLLRLPSISLCSENSSAKFDIDCSWAFPICLFSMKEFDSEEEAINYKEKIKEEIIESSDFSFLAEILSCYSQCAESFIKTFNLKDKEEAFIEEHKPAVHIFACKYEVN